MEKLTANLSKVAFISLSSNPDMVAYFALKIRHFRSLGSSFYTSKDALMIDHSGHIEATPIVSSGKNRLSLGIFSDSLNAILNSIFKIHNRGVKVVIFENEHYLNSVIALILKILGIKSIFSIHDFEPHEGRMRVVFKIYNYFVRNFLASAFVCFSQASHSQLVKVKPTYLTKLIGFSLLEQTNMERGKHFLWFGRIEPYKGLDNLLHILKELDARGLRYSVIIAGNGYDPSIEPLSKNPSVEILNRFIPEDELNALLQNSIATLLPYKSATQSGVILKSFSALVPAICFDVGSLKEYVRDGCSGYLVSPQNYKGFAEKIELSIKEEPNLKSNLRELMHGEHSPKHILSDYRKGISLFLKEHNFTQ